MKLARILVSASFLCILLLPSAFLYAEENNDANVAVEEDALCRELDYRYRFSKKGVGEIDILGGNYIGDYSQNTWAVGGRGYVHINHMFAVGAEYLYAHLRADSSSNFGKNLTNKNQHALSAQLMINNEILFAAGKSQIPMDLYLTVGGGAVRMNSDWAWLAVIGGGVKIYLKPKWMALRIDVNSYIHDTPPAGKNEISGDVSFLFGLAFHFPYRPPQTGL